MVGGCAKLQQTVPAGNIRTGFLFPLRSGYFVKLALGEWAPELGSGVQCCFRQEFNHTLVLEEL